MPSGTRDKLSCEAKKEQQSNHQNRHTVMSVLSMNQFNNNQSGHAGTCYKDAPNALQAHDNEEVYDVVRHTGQLTGARGDTKWR